MMTFHTLLHQYLQSIKHKPSVMVYHRLAEQYFFRWPDTWPTRMEVTKWHEEHRATPSHANKGLKLLRAAYNWGVRHELYDGKNPTLGIKLHKTFSRERVMTAQEIGLVLSTLDMLPLKLSALLGVLIYTGCRMTEARSMQWSHIDWTTGYWTQPKTKNGKAHTTYLPEQARSLLTLLPQRGDYVFRGAYEQCWSGCGVEKAWRIAREALNLRDVRLHDFRRTVATHLYRQEKDEYLVKRCLNHLNPSVTAIYVRISIEEVAKALQTLANRFDTYKGGPHANLHSGLSDRFPAVDNLELRAGLLELRQSRESVERVPVDTRSQRPFRLV